MRLNQGQISKLLEWIAEGCKTDEINRRAEVMDPPWNVTRGQVQHYRRTREQPIKAKTAAMEESALATGLALRENRVAKLQQLAALLEQDLFGEKHRRWVKDIKIFRTKTVEIERFNQAEISEYRAILDQIAGEVGDRKPDQIVPSEIRVTFVKPEAKPNG